ncbi:maleylpyruvate isomerase N-terminal domain-containing protein [Streptomyces sp. PSAA01]|uniref:maleylpyruvate isomerase N-terminal domain-containing protein n=1 Tax=Streptomyces sp. PSAA01 TaxID=2912762 RepID=UPI0035AC1AD3
MVPSKRNSGWRTEVDRTAEGDELDALVSAQTDWTRPTPAAGWTIAHQIAHLASADANVLIAIRTPDADRARHPVISCGLRRRYR